MTAGGVPLSDHYGVAVTLKDFRADCSWWERVRYYCLTEPYRPPQMPFTAVQNNLDGLCEANITIV